MHVRTEGEPMRGVYPGTFDPPTIAHLAIAEAARDQCGLARIDLAVNRDPLGKSEIRPLSTRVAMLEAVAAARAWLSVVVTEDRHLADIAVGYDVLVLGADKWQQLLDPIFYASEAARDDAVRRLPKLAIAPRGGVPLPANCEVLAVDLSHVSATAARAGRLDYVAPEARPFVDF